MTRVLLVGVGVLAGLYGAHRRDEFGPDLRRGSLRAGGHAAGAAQRKADTEGKGWQQPRTCVGSGGRVHVGFHHCRAGAGAARP